ncbi:MAG TPA: enoyl-CoA hydratase/isomerase family protein [Pseudonocardiaceae bacterium]|nr:enoyl-CoA hydratase/isomerase family protein [Pseudonocardiaceae bacterium]
MTIELPPAGNWISPASLANGQAHQPLLDGSGMVVDPLFVVDLDVPTDRDMLARAALAARSCDRVLIGVATDGGPLDLAMELDLTLTPGRPTRPAPCFAESLDPAADAGLLLAAAAASPQAALVLARLLRESERQTVPAALDVESLAYSTLLGGKEFQRWLNRRGPRPLPPPAAGPVVLSERTDRRLHITLNRPERRNAYGREVRDALVEALDLALLDGSVDHVLLDGAGPCFCAGGDLGEFGTAPDLATAHFVRTRAGAGRLLHRLADRVEVRLHGSCVGAGIELPAFAGRVVARPDTTFRLPEVGMGLIPGAGGTVSIPRRIGRWRTLLLALSGRALAASTALSWGLVDELAG